MRRSSGLFPVESLTLAVCGVIAGGRLGILLIFVQVVALGSLDCGRAGFWGIRGVLSIELSCG